MPRVYKGGKHMHEMMSLRYEWGGDKGFGTHPAHRTNAHLPLVREGWEEMALVLLAPTFSHQPVRKLVAREGCRTGWAAG